MSATYETSPATRTTKQGSRIGILLLVTALVILIDRITKHLVTVYLPNGHAHTVIPGFFRITDVHNTGAAFSMFADAAPTTVRNVLIGFSVIAIILIFAFLWRVANALTITSVALALILGGAIGNLYDRIAYHHVVDFLEFHIANYHYPDFNIADSCIVVGACLLLIEIFRPQAATQDL